MTLSIAGSSVLANLGMLDKICRNLMLSYLASLQQGCIELVEGHDKQLLGDPQADLRVTLTVVDPAFYQKLVLGGSVGAGESYIEGHWRTDNLTALVQIFARNMALLDKLESGWARLSKPALKLLNWRNRNSVSQSKKNISAHYDLGNSMYQLFLDNSMMYSSAVYPSPEASLAEAQQHKLKLICDKLQLKASDHLIEIGTGWGSLAIFAARNYGCRVTTTTISREQFDYAKKQIEAAGLSEQITLLFQDYRELSGQYDKLVSVEMIEAVGHEYLDGYFAKCSSLLKPEGLMVLQAITIADQRYEFYRREVDFIKKFVFPGGCLPSMLRMTQAAAQHTDLVIRHVQDIGLDYARTLADWCNNFMAARDAVHQLGYDDRFVRLWHFYLCYCEGGFLERATSAVHLVLTKPGHRQPV
ncbi:MAG TPA: SAM-dependent methyltransferase [Rheinheimera sp.]|uniref:SAM-dependent methyltransferase n=1 Tax=Rheinheimera sp. TaxID=1869214 RepID=UPI000EC8632C|nr:cyclopropane-fatty-acyl-phospholipid synthase family protein [Rheinheimera sp.]HCU66787.1 SAM-dependent methyltransferase [Rheinheimera sp.]